ncbi:MAG: hypothetical protein GF341_13590 [candidate division Zixibacteria bacterium]|nr:hypothetical protein [candidate division Zixibacteria bacterium]
MRPPTDTKQMNVSTMSTFVFLCITMCLCVIPTRASDRIASLIELYDAKQFFNLRDSVQQIGTIDDPHIDFYRGAVLNKFNDLDAAIEHLQRFLFRIQPVDTTLVIEAHSLLGDSYFKSFDYAFAESTYHHLVTHYGPAMDSARLADAQNMMTILTHLGGVPPQEVRIEQSFELQLRGGLVPLTLNGQSHALAFDTGANLSVLIRSLAHQLELDVMHAGIEVSTISGKRIMADLAVVDSVQIGQAFVQNAIFLILDDSAMYIPQADFQIEGLIGFPVISGLGQLTWTGPQSLRVPESPQECTENNLCLDGLTPLIAGTFRDNRLIFAFDSGADRTVFYRPFYNTFREYLEPRCVTDTESVIGVGGYRNIPACRIDSIRLTLAAQPVVLDSAVILKGKSIDDSEYYFGNIGRDATDRFEAIILNFESMCIQFHE